MSKLNQNANSNTKVLDETQLQQVVGGHHRGYRRQNYGHCYKNRHNHDSYKFGNGYEDKGYGEDSYGNDPFGYGDDDRS